MPTEAPTVPLQVFEARIEKKDHYLDERMAEGTRAAGKGKGGKGSHKSGKGKGGKGKGKGGHDSGKGKGGKGKGA